jgi:hypothetical protein
MGENSVLRLNKRAMDLNNNHEWNNPTFATLQTQLDISLVIYAYYNIGICRPFLSFMLANTLMTS